MKTGGKILIGGILGMIVTSLLSSTYFYRFINKVIRDLKVNLKDYNY